MSELSAVELGDAETIAVLYASDDTELAARLADEVPALETTSVGSVEDAASRVEGGGVDCVVADDRLTGGSLELLSAVRADHPDLPVVIVAPGEGGTGASEAFAAGATDHVRRRDDPEDAVVLARRVESAVERYRSEQRAARTERRLQEVVEHTPDVRWLYDDDWSDLLFVNSAYESVYGGSVERLREEPDSFLETVHPADRDRVVAAMKRAAAGQSATEEYRVDPRTDYERWVQASAHPIREDGEVVRVVGYSREITERKRREQELQRQGAILTALNDGVYALDDEGRFTYVNDAFLDLVGYDRETVVGADVSLVKDEAAIEAGEHHLGALLSDGDTDSSVFEMEIQPREGDPVPCEDHMAVLEDDGEFVGSAGVLRDISERRERERELQETQELLSGSLDALDDIHYVLDTDGRIERWNDALLDVTGYDPAEVAGEPAVEFFAEADREAVLSAMEEVVDTGHSRVDADVVTADGERIPYEFNGARLEGPDGDLQGIIGVGRDVSTRVEYERSLEEKNDRLQEFAGIVSHDLRNPIVAVRSDLELYRATGDSRHLDDLAETTKRMERLLDDLLDVARSGESVEHPEPVDLDEVVRLARAGTLPETASIGCDPTPPLMADRDRLHRLVENLLRNAAEHAGSDVAVRIGPLGEWPTEDGSADAVDGFYVADDGPGIPAERRDRVFESGVSTAEDGTGYGLAVVRSVAEAHGWTVSVTESAEGGARFEIRGVEFVDGDPEGDAGE